MGNSWGLKRQKPKVPPPSKFDRLSPEDLFTATEQAVANAVASLEASRRDPSDEKAEAHLYLALTHLETGHMALAAMIRKNEVRKAVARE